MVFTTSTSSADLQKKEELAPSLKKERSLPAANTCAFRITLPDYPSQEALAAKLRYAIAEGRKFFDKT